MQAWCESEWDQDFLGQPPPFGREPGPQALRCGRRCWHGSLEPQSEACQSPPLRLKADESDSNTQSRDRRRRSRVGMGALGRREPGLGASQKVVFDGQQWNIKTPRPVRKSRHVDPFFRPQAGTENGFPERSLRTAFSIEMVRGIAQDFQARYRCRLAHQTSFRMTIRPSRIGSSTLETRESASTILLKACSALVRSS